MVFVFIRNLSSPSTNNFSFFLTVEIAHAKKCSDTPKSKRNRFCSFLLLWGTSLILLCCVISFTVSNMQLSTHACRDDVRCKLTWVILQWLQWIFLCARCVMITYAGVSFHYFQPKNAQTYQAAIYLKKTQKWKAQIKFCILRIRWFFCDLFSATLEKFQNENLRFQSKIFENSNKQVFLT